MVRSPDPALYGYRKVDRDPHIDAIYASMPPIDQATHDRVIANALKVAALLSGTHTDVCEDGEA